MAAIKGLNQGVAPVTYGTGSRPPRGDYGRAGSDYTCAQNHAQYTAFDHETYRRLHTRQLQQLPGLACDEFINAVQQLGEPSQIPRFDAISERLMRATGWQVVGVPGLIPEEAFFALLAERRFPVTDWIRKPEEFDYVVEPDIFHDLFGHVPLLFNPVFADYMRGSVRLAAIQKAPSIFVWTHDSIGVGEDGPTHQPVAQIASIRAMSARLSGVRPRPAKSRPRFIGMATRRPRKPACISAAMARALAVCAAPSFAVPGRFWRVPGGWISPRP